MIRILISDCLYHFSLNSTFNDCVHEWLSLIKNALSKVCLLNYIQQVRFLLLFLKYQQHFFIGYTVQRRHTRWWRHSSWCFGFLLPRFRTHSIQMSLLIVSRHAYWYTWWDGTTRVLFVKWTPRLTKALYNICFYSRISCKSDTKVRKFRHVL